MDTASQVTQSRNQPMLLLICCGQKSALVICSNSSYVCTCTLLHKLSKLNKPLSVWVLKGVLEDCLEGYHVNNFLKAVIGFKKRLGVRYLYNMHTPSPPSPPSPQLLHPPFFRHETTPFPTPAFPLLPLPQGKTETPPPSNSTLASNAIRTLYTDPAPHLPSQGPWLANTPQPGTGRAACPSHSTRRVRGLCIGQAMCRGSHPVCELGCWGERGSGILGGWVGEKAVVVEWLIGLAGM